MVANDSSSGADRSNTAYATTLATFEMVQIS